MKIKLSAIGLFIAVAMIYAGDSTRPTVVSSKNVRARTNDNGTVRVQLLLPKDITGDPRFYFGRAEFEPGAIVAEHVHEKSAEIIYVIHGTGQFTVSGTVHEIEPGTSIYIPENTPHSFTNNGKEKVEVVQFYSPSGPEDRFLKWKE